MHVKLLRLAGTRCRFVRTNMIRNIWIIMARVSPSVLHGYIAFTHRHHYPRLHYISLLHRHDTARERDTTWFALISVTHDDSHHVAACSRAILCNTYIGFAFSKYLCGFLKISSTRALLLIINFFFRYTIDLMLLRFSRDFTLYKFFDIFLIA